MSKPEIYTKFSRSCFDYIIIDEVHRAGAESYRRILDYFTPTFLLGMSATPDRTDHFNIYELFDYNIGVINQIFNVFGIQSINWINNESLVTVPIIVVSVWKEMGYNMMIFYVGLKAISRELYESAALDGVNHWQRLRYITIPQLKPITLFVCVMAMIKFVKVFTQAITMTSGSQSSGNTFKTLVYYIYQQGFSLHSMGRASAAAMVLLLIIFLLTALQMRLSKED